MCWNIVGKLLYDLKTIICKHLDPFVIFKKNTGRSGNYKLFTTMAAIIFVNGYIFGLFQMLGKLIAFKLCKTHLRLTLEIFDI